MTGSEGDIQSVGWDIGGAHVKVAALDRRGRIVAAQQLPCPLWRGIDQLHAALGQALAALPSAGPPIVHAATMTGELADLFSDRREGVQRIVAGLREVLGARPLVVFAGARGFLGAEQALAHSDEVASANWLATAQLVAARLGDGLLVDIGSTTTDLVAVRGGRVCAGGRNDLERLISGELVYTGVVRTSLMALTDAVEFEGWRVPLMAEHFATTADIYRITGELDEHSDQHPSADGAEKTRDASARRLARMIGCDAGSRPAATWEQLAATFRSTQIERIRRAAQLVLLRGEVGLDAPVVAAGSGAFLAPDVADYVGRPTVDFARLVESQLAPEALARCAPAVAVAVLAPRTAA